MLFIGTTFAAFAAAADVVVTHSSFLLLDLCVDCDLICDPYPIAYDLQAAAPSFPSFLFLSRRCDTNRQLDLVVVMSLRRRVTALLVANRRRFIPPSDSSNSFVVRHSLTDGVVQCSAAPSNSKNKIDGRINASPETTRTSSSSSSSSGTADDLLLYNKKKKDASYTCEYTVRRLRPPTTLSFFSSVCPNGRTDGRTSERTADTSVGH